MGVGSVGGSRARACSRPGTRLRLFWKGAFGGVGEEKCEVLPPNEQHPEWRRDEPRQHGPCHGPHPVLARRPASALAARIILDG